MALEIGVNSYISVLDADTYFADRLYTDDWDNSDAVTRTKALVTATQKIDTLRFRGKKMILFKHCSSREFQIILLLTIGIRC